MYTKEQLKQHLSDMGLKPTDAIMVHSSMKSIGPVEGGADTVLDALMEYFEPGLLMLPTHTWAQINPEYNVFNPATEPACVGLLPNMFMKREGVVRSLHPTHSIAAYGKTAQEFLRGEEDAQTPCPIGGAWDRLREVNAKILLLGVTHTRNTFIHAADEAFDVPDRLEANPFPAGVVMPNGSVKMRMYRRHESTYGGVSEYFDKLRYAFEECGAAKNTVFGDAKCILCDANGIFDVCARVMKHEPECFTVLETIPEEWWRE